MRKYKQHILYTVIVTILLGLITINSSSDISALSYSSSVGVGFTFNPTLSVNISPSDLTISNLAPGTTNDSNTINVSVATNAAYGYTLSAVMYGNNDNLIHTNSIDAFSSIATNADLSSLDNSEDTNIWGYSYKLSNENVWNNYSGLSTETSKTLVDSNDQIAIPINFKIAAKASSTQASGTYTGTINFTAVTKHIPVTLTEAYASEGKTMVNGFYTMQDMTSTICNKVEAIGAQLQVLDERDNKLYWISKLADNHCWMTQNLDLDLSHDRPLTSENTDLNDSSLSGAYSKNYAYNSTNEVITWTPEKTTKIYGLNIGDKWADDYNQSNSIDIEQWYWNGNDDTPNCNFLTTKCDNFSQTPSNEHFSVGNYYNWSAAIASDNSISLTQSTYTDITNNPKNSICAKNWRLPTISDQSDRLTDSTNEFGRLNLLYNTDSTRSDSNLIVGPLWFMRSGVIGGGSLYSAGSEAVYWSSTVYDTDKAQSLYFARNSFSSRYQGYRSRGWSIRCLAR